MGSLLGFLAVGLLLTTACGGGSTGPKPGVVASAATSTPAAPTTAASVTPEPTSQALTGRTVVVDPGHNGGNGSHPEIINRQVDAGGFQKACDTAGAETNAGYPEYAFTLDVALRMVPLLKARGADVVLTRSDSTGIGPCVNERAARGNEVHAAAAISVHADGGPPSGVGFHVIRPGLLAGRNDAVVGPSEQLATAVRQAVLATGEPISNYAGSDGIDTRTDLGGLNLSTVPKVFVECGNMRNSADAARLSDPAFRQRLAEALVNGLTSFVD